jgi:hypothetical protein
LIFSHKNMNNPLFNMKSVIKGSYKADVGAGAGSGAGARAGAGAGVGAGDETF